MITELISARLALHRRRRLLGRICTPWGATLIGLATIFAGCSSGKSSSNSTAGDGNFTSLSPAANDALVQAPFDATPSPDGSLIYFTALMQQEDGSSEPGVFMTSAEGGDITPLHVGAPLASPIGITVSLDGATLYIADAAAITGTAEDVEDNDERGAVMTVPTAGGAVAVLAGTEGMSPGGVVIARVGSSSESWLYFSGQTAAEETPGVFRVSPSGGTPTVLASGAALREPAGIAATGDGVVFVIDAQGSDELASVVRIAEGEVSTVLPNIGVGFPAGIALVQNESALLISGLHPTNRTDLVYRVELDPFAVSEISAGIDGFSEPAGIHRAHDVDVYAWADAEANDTGTVYVLK